MFLWHSIGATKIRRFIFLFAARYDNLLLWDVWGVKRMTDQRAVQRRIPGRCVCRRLRHLSGCNPGLSLNLVHWSDYEYALPGTISGHTEVNLSPPGVETKLD
jgi:hypothetical protein